MKNLFYGYYKRGDMMIKFIHTGDLHLGLKFKSANFHSDRRRFELWDTFEKIVKKAVDEEVDFLFIAGDLFEERYFTLKDIKRVRSILSTAENVEVLISTGNHDTLGSNSLYYSVEWPENVAIFKTHKISKREYADKNTVVYGFSWHNGEINQELFKDFEGLDRTKTNILLIHGDALTKDSKYLPLDLSHLLNLGFDYIALGHIHKPNIMYDKAAYCGSPEPLDFGETGEHGIIKGRIENNTTIIEFVPFSMRKFVEDTIELNEDLEYTDILNKIRSSYSLDERKKNFYRITLEGFVSPEAKIIASNLEKELENDFYYVEIINRTKLSFDLDELEREYKDNIIGYFIKEMKKRDLEDEVNRQALYLGLEILMKGKVEA